MKDSFDVQFSGRTVGTATVQREGLFYRFSCRCRLEGEGKYRMTVNCGSVTEDLGLLIPEGEEFVLIKRLPAKRIGSGDMKFSILPKHETLAGRFIPIHPEEPFAYIKALKHAYLQRRNGEVGIVIPQDEV